MELKVIIVDDEPPAQQLIESLLENVPKLKVVGCYGTGQEAIEAINLLRPNILFLDIQLKSMTGFELLNELVVQLPLVIFVTAYDEYAIDAFNIFAFDYLLKPFTEERFYESVLKATQSLNRNVPDELNFKTKELLNHVKQIEINHFSSKIAVPFNNKTVFVNKEDIYYVLASNYYIEIFALDTKYVLRSSMLAIMHELNSNSFVRVHRSSIINLNQITEIINSAYGEIDIKMRDGKQLRVSRGYRQKFLIKIGLKK